ncbi:MAG: HNH endonuclease, partial [Planctomycetota bacterium]
MSQYVPLQLRREVRQRAGQNCEYCLLHEDDALLPYEPDHIIAVKHGGATSAGNLAWTCFLCNRAKGSDVASIDPQTGEVVQLYSPRRDVWAEHFSLDDTGAILGQSPSGRATVSLLKFNRPEQIEIRQILIDSGIYP